MKKIDNPFLALYQTIDLHGYDSISAIIKVKEFITDSLHLRYYDLIVIHGKGSGILKKSVHEYLKSDRRVKEFKLDNFNDGATIIKLKGEDVL